MKNYCCVDVFHWGQYTYTCTCTWLPPDTLTPFWYYPTYSTLHPIYSSSEPLTAQIVAYVKHAPYRKYSSQVPPRAPDWYQDTTLIYGWYATVASATVRELARTIPIRVIVLLSHLGWWTQIILALRELHKRFGALFYLNACRKHTTTTVISYYCTTVMYCYSIILLYIILLYLQYKATKRVVFYEMLCSEL